MNASTDRAHGVGLVPNRKLALWAALVMWAIAGVISLAMAIQRLMEWIQSVDDRLYVFVVENEFGALVWIGRPLGMFGSLWVMAPPHS